MPDLAPRPAPTQDDIDAMTSLRATATATRSDLAPIAARLTAKRSLVQTLAKQLASAKGGA